MTSNTPPPSSTQSPISNTKYLLLLPLVFLLSTLFTTLFTIPFSSPNAEFTDLLISHYPNALYLKKAILEYHTIPLWSPTILSGYPFAANPLSGMWYPPGWLALFFPLPLGFTILITLHLVLGGVGMYRLLRTREVRHAPALFGALAFEFMPKLFAHYGAGHLTLLYAIPWTPWLLLALTPTLTPNPSPKGRGESASAPPLLPGEGPGVRASVSPKWKSGVILALIFLADPRWAAYAGLLWLAYVISYSQYNLKQKAKYILTSLELTLALSAPLLIPLLEYTSLSTRRNLAPNEVLSHSLTPAQLLGLLFPSGGGSVEWVAYAGGAGLVFAVLALTVPRIRKRASFWLGVGGLSLVFALGDHLPGLELLARLPGFSLLRVPPRTLFLLGLALACLSAYALDELLTIGPGSPRHFVQSAGDFQGNDWPLSRAARLSLMGLVTFVLILGGGILALTGELPLPVGWGMGALTLAALWVGVGREHVSPQVWVVGLFVLGIVDWSGAGLMNLDFHATEEVFVQQHDLATYLAEEPGLFRVYSPSYSLPQHVAAQHGLELADGVDPLQIAAYAEFMESATGVPQEGYSVTLPPFAGGDPSRDNAASVPNPELLGQLNVRYVAAEFDLVVDGLILREQFGETRLYENEHALPRAWVQPDYAELGQGAYTADLVAWEPNRIAIRAEGPGLLVLSEIAYPGWRVTIDGQRGELGTIAGILRGVELTEGEHQVEFVFRPVSVYLGLALFVVGLGFVSSQKIGD